MHRVSLLECVYEVSDAVSGRYVKSEIETGVGLHQDLTRCYRIPPYPAILAL